MRMRQWVPEFSADPPSCRRATPSVPVSTTCRPGCLLIDSYLPITFSPHSREIALLHMGFPGWRLAAGLAWSSGLALATVIVTHHLASRVLYEKHNTLVSTPRGTHTKARRTLFLRMRWLCYTGTPTHAAKEVPWVADSLRGSCRRVRTLLYD